MMNKSLISFNRNKIYTSLENPDLNFSDQKLKLLIKLTNKLGEFGYIIDSDAIRYLDISDIKEYLDTVIPILYKVYKHEEYVPEDLINIDDWKSRHVSDFYNSGDFRFIFESSKKLNLPINYLDMMTESDLYNIFVGIIGSSKDPSVEEENELSYLSTIFSNVYANVAGNKTSRLILNLANKSYNFNAICDVLEYSDYKLSRSERRLVLEKMESFINSNGLENTVISSRDSSKRSWLRFFKNIHPKDYKNVFPKTYEFYSYLVVGKSGKGDISKLSAFEKAKALLDSRPDEFANQFGALMLKAEEENNGSEADIASLLCTGKLEIQQLIKITEYLQKKELGISRFYDSGSVKKPNKCFDRGIISTTKEFILNGISIKNKNKEASEKLGFKKIWLDPDLRNYDYIHRSKTSYHKEYLGKVQLGDNLTSKTFWTDRTTIYYSHTRLYLWKGVGNDFKVVDHRYVDAVERGQEETISSKININLYKSLGYKYIVFYNRTSYHHGVISGSPVYFQFIEPKDRILSIIQSKNECRNRFGGLLDLNNGDLWLINSDISLLPTYNGNSAESIVRCIFDSFRFSVYDYLENYCIANGAIIVESKTDCDIKYTHEEYEQNKSINNDDKIVIF